MTRICRWMAVLLLVGGILAWNAIPVHAAGSGRGGGGGGGKGGGGGGSRGGGGSSSRAGTSGGGSKFSLGSGRTPTKTPSSQGRFDALKNRVSSQYGIPRPFQDHHLIPWSLRDHSAVTKGGVKIGSRKNLIMLPTDDRITDPKVGGNRTIHKGGHSTQRMKEALDRIDRIGVRKGWNRDMYEKALDRLQFRERLGLKTGQIRLNKNHR